jgi:KduI/IolB family
MKHRSESWKWLSSVETVEIDGGFASRTGAVETLLVVLHGTFDIVAGGGQWPARGVRTSPFAGKPVALFLPPNTGFELQSGHGAILLVSGIQPVQEEQIGEATSKKPLLAMAGSGKAFDPATGEWKDQEMFPSSPQALLPRHIEQDLTPGATVRHVFPWHFKALCLSLDEIVIEAGTTVDIPPAQAPDYPTERVAYYDTSGALTIDGTEVHGQGCADITARSQFTAETADAYLALAYAGPKP